MTLCQHRGPPRAQIILSYAPVASAIQFPPHAGNPASVAARVGKRSVCTTPSARQTARLALLRCWPRVDSLAPRPDYAVITLTYALFQPATPSRSLPYTSLTGRSTICGFEFNPYVDQNHCLFSTRNHTRPPTVMRATGRENGKINEHEGLRSLDVPPKARTKDSANAATPHSV